MWLHHNSPWGQRELRITLQNHGCRRTESGLEEDHQTKVQIERRTFDEARFESLFALPSAQVEMRSVSLLWPRDPALKTSNSA